jgi:hypothetical protein
VTEPPAAQPAEPSEEAAGGVHFHTHPETTLRIERLKGIVLGWSVVADAVWLEAGEDWQEPW